MKEIKLFPNFFIWIEIYNCIKVIFHKFPYQKPTNIICLHQSSYLVFILDMSRRKFSSSVSLQHPHLKEKFRNEWRAFEETSDSLFYIILSWSPNIIDFSNRLHRTWLTEEGQLLNVQTPKAVTWDLSKYLTKTSGRARWDTRSIFKWGTAFHSASQVVKPSERAKLALMGRV